MTGDERVRFYAERLVRRVFAFHDAEDGGALYDPMMEAAADLRTALAGEVPPRRRRRPGPTWSPIDGPIPEWVRRG